MIYNQSYDSASYIQSNTYDLCCTVGRWWKLATAITTSNSSFPISLKYVTISLCTRLACGLFLLAISRRLYDISTPVYDIVLPNVDSNTPNNLPSPHQSSKIRKFFFVGKDFFICESIWSNSGQWRLRVPENFSAWLS